MNRNKTPLAVLAASCIVFVTVLILTHDRLPERIADHFNAANEPNGWASRTSHLWTMAGLGLGLPAFMLGVFYCTRFFPTSTIHLPRRDYWLAPARRGETFHFVFRAGIWLACAEVLFMLGLHWQLVAANTSVPPHLSSGIWLLAGLFLIFASAWLFMLMRRFNRDAATGS